MPSLAASVSWIFTESALPERFALAAQVGFRAVEIQAPYSESAETLAACAHAAGVSVALINTPAALAAVPGEEAAFRTSWQRALAYASALHCPRVHCLAGPSDAPNAEATFVENVRWAADAASAHGVRVMLEPLNTVDHPDYFLTSTAQAIRIIEQVQRSNVRLQYDCYHMQIMEGRLTDTIAAHFDLIDHIQISGVPGRFEPDAQQEINYPFVLARLDALGYDGWVGCEYRPRHRTSEGLDWARPYGITMPLNEQEQPR